MTASPSVLFQPGSESEIRRLSFHGDGVTLLGITLRNALLTLLTLGFYSFWAKARVRKYLYGQTEFDGDRFEYRGTGEEHLRGWFKALLLFGSVLGIFYLIQFLWKHPVANLVSVLFFYLSFLFLFPIALVGSRRYRMSRTAWRGICFSFRGHVRKFIGIYLPGILLTLLTLGFYAPFYHTRMREFLVNHTYFGKRPLRFDGRGADLFWPFFLSLLLTLPTLGFCWIWFTARQERYYWEHTSFDSARFRCTLTGGGLLQLELVNLFLVLITLGIATPWVTVRKMRFVMDHLYLVGPVDWGAIQQEVQTASATGEGLAGFFDADGLDMNLGF